MEPARWYDADAVVSPVADAVPMRSLQRRTVDDRRARACRKATTVEESSVQRCGKRSADHRFAAAGNTDEPDLEDRIHVRARR